MPVWIQENSAEMQGVCNVELLGCWPVSTAWPPMQPQVLGAIDQYCLSSAVLAR
jgi:hypothetical protein